MARAVLTRKYHHVRVEDALAAAENTALSRQLQQMHAAKVAAGWHADEDVRQAMFSRAHDLQLEPEVIGLLTNPKVFLKIVDLVGTNIYTWHAFSPSTRAAPPGTAAPGDDDHTRSPLFGFHRDGGFEAYFAERPCPRVTVKAIFYLSDCSTAGCGNTWVVRARRPQRKPETSLRTWR